MPRPCLGRRAVALGVKAGSLPRSARSPPTSAPPLSPNLFLFLQTPASVFLRVPTQLQAKTQAPPAPAKPPRPGQATPATPPPRGRPRPLRGLRPAPAGDAGIAASRPPAWRSPRLPGSLGPSVPPSLPPPSILRRQPRPWVPGSRPPRPAPARPRAAFAAAARGARLSCSDSGSRAQGPAAAGRPWRRRRGGGSARERRARSRAPPSCRPGGRGRPGRSGARGGSGLPAAALPALQRLPPRAAPPGGCRP